MSLPNRSLVDNQRYKLTYTLKRDKSSLQEATIEHYRGKAVSGQTES